MILLTFESLLAGPMFARCAFKGALREAKLDAVQTDERHVYVRMYVYIYIYIYIYKEDFAQQYNKCGLAQARPNNNAFMVKAHVYI